jgi:hypothetical protein
MEKGADDRLTYDEVVGLLRRATVLQREQDDREFTRGELLEAARELGLSEGVVTRALETRSARREATALAPRPFDTRIALEVTDERLVLDVPPTRFSAKVLPGLGFTAFWFAFMAFWTQGAARGSAVFAAFSIPFWIVGALSLWRVVRPLVRKTRLELGPEKGRLEIRPFGRRRELLSRVLTTRVGTIESVLDSQNRRQPSIPVLVVEHGTETFNLLEGYTDQERRWVDAELKAWIAQNNALERAPG